MLGIVKVFESELGGSQTVLFLSDLPLWEIEIRTRNTVGSIGYGVRKPLGQKQSL